MPIIRLLHLSDLCGASAADLPDAIQGTPWSQLLDEIADGGLVDMICVTGDISRSGRSEDFSTLTPILEQSRARLGVASDRLFVVPGDRDVDRRLDSDLASQLQELARGEPAATAAWSAGHGRAPLGANAQCLRALFQRQRAFWDWVSDDLNQPERREVDALGYHARVPLSGGGQVHVFGLNSAWLMGNELTPEEDLLLGREQVAALVHDESGAPHKGLRLALIHHPPDRLRDWEQCVPLLAGAVDLVLCGHGPHAHFNVLAGSQVRQLAGRPLGGAAGRPPACQLVQVETDGSGRPLGFAARMWTWSSGEKRWLGESPDLPGTRRGRLYWPGTAPSLKRASPSEKSRSYTLAAILARIFTSADELRKWLCMRLPDIYADLPGGNASLSDLAYAAQGLLERRGMIDDDLLDALADFSPAHGPAVVELSKWFGQAAPSAPPPQSQAPTASVLATLHPLHAAKPRDRREAKGPEVKSHDLRILSGLLPNGRGQVLGNGRYVLRSLLGRGGFATVWRARDTREGRDVAVKLMHPQDAQDVARCERFFRGARAMHLLQHPAIVRVLDPRAGESPQPFFVMEIVEGKNLHEALAGKPHINLHDIINIIGPIGEALATAHLRGMVHRDIKPANILLDRRGAPHLTDFDLVRARDISGGTRTGGMGTVLYAAPELIQNAEDADARADIYGLGMTVLFMLFGNDPPYKDIVRNPEAILASVACPLAIKRVVLRAIDWDREQRFPDIGKFCAALRDAAGPHPRQHVPMSPPLVKPYHRSSSSGTLQHGPKPRPTPRPSPDPAPRPAPQSKPQATPQPHPSRQLTPEPTRTAPPKAAVRSQTSPALRSHPVVKSPRSSTPQPRPNLPATRKHTSYGLWGLCSLAVATIVLVLALGPTPPGKTVPGGTPAASDEPYPGVEPPPSAALLAGTSSLRAQAGSIADAKPRHARDEEPASQTTGLPAEVVPSAPSEPKSPIVMPAAPQRITRAPKIAGTYQAAPLPPSAEATEVAAPIEPPTAPPPKPSLEELKETLRGEIKRYGDSKTADCLSEEVGLDRDQDWAVDAVISMALIVGADGRIAQALILESGGKDDLAMCMGKKLNGQQLASAPGSTVTVNVDFGF